MKALLPLTALLAVLSIPAEAQVSTYVEPQLLWSKAKMENLNSSKFGFGLTGGCRVGPKGEHDFNLGLGYTPYSYSKTYSETINGIPTSITESLELKATTLLFSYRYVIAIKDSPVSFYAGPVIGFTRAKVSSTSTGRGNLPDDPGPVVFAAASDTVIAAATSSATATDDVTENASGSDTALTYGGTLGMVWKLSATIDLNLGYRYTTTKVDLSDDKPKSRLTTNALTAGIGYKF